MNGVRASIYTLLIISLINGSARADLSSPTYASAKIAYVNMDWATALNRLNQYQNEDSAFLSANPSISQAIANAINYCNRKIKVASTSGQGILIAAGVGGSGGSADGTTSQPPLPSPPSIATSGFPPGYGMKVCGCWGPNPPPTEVESRCASGRVRTNACSGFCAPGHPVYAYVCL